jgi:hypothetical protein
MSKPSIYLAAPFGARSDVEAIASLLCERGYTITSSWHAIGPDVVEPVTRGPVVTAWNENRLCMQAADAFVLLAHPGGAEMWCELSVWCTWHVSRECVKPVIVDFGSHLALTAKRFGIIVRPEDGSIDAVADAIESAFQKSGPLSK